MKNNIVTKSATVIAGMILFLAISGMFVGAYILLGLWFVVIPAILGALIGSKRFDDLNPPPKPPGFTEEDMIKSYEEYDRNIAKKEKENKTVH